MIGREELPSYPKEVKRTLRMLKKLPFSVL